jgi:5-hydroxyisourate hydrolase-like protein (transthyretin family)
MDLEMAPKVFDTGIYGIVTDSETGTPLAEVYISLYEFIDDQNGQGYQWVSDFQTKDDGTYSFEVYEGSFVVSAGKEGYDQYVSDTIVLVSGDSVELNIGLSEWTRGVTGTVYDENGDPLEGVAITLEGGNGRRAGEFTATTDENGFYEIRVPWGGQYTLKAFYDGYRPYNEDVQVPQDDMLEQDIDMQKAILPGPLLQIVYFILSLIGYM